MDSFIQQGRAFLTLKNTLDLLNSSPLDLTDMEQQIQEFSFEKKLLLDTLTQEQAQDKKTGSLPNLTKLKNSVNVNSFFRKKTISSTHVKSNKEARIQELNQLIHQLTELVNEINSFIETKGIGKNSRM